MPPTKTTDVVDFIFLSEKKNQTSSTCGARLNYNMYNWTREEKKIHHSDCFLCIMQHKYTTALGILCIILLYQIYTDTYINKYCCAQMMRVNSFSLFRLIIVLTMCTLYTIKIFSNSRFQCGRNSNKSFLLNTLIK